MEQNYFPGWSDGSWDHGAVLRQIFLPLSDMLRVPGPWDRFEANIPSNRTPTSLVYAMSTVTRFGRSSRPPPDRDQAMVPLVHRGLDEGSGHTPGTMNPAMASLAEQDNAGEPDASTPNTSLNSTANAPLEPSR